MQFFLLACEMWFLIQMKYFSANQISCEVLECPGASFLYAPVRTFVLLHPVIKDVNPRQLELFPHWGFQLFLSAICSHTYGELMNLYKHKNICYHHMPSTHA